MAVIGSRTPIGGMGRKTPAMVAAGIATAAIAVGVAAAIMPRSGVVSAPADMAACSVAAAAGMASTRGVAAAMRLGEGRRRACQYRQNACRQ
jgi:hypothetical protein